MPSYLVDTDWVIQYLNRDQRIRDRLDACRREGLCVSAISVGELIDGAHGAKNPAQGLERVRDFLHGVEILPVDGKSGELWREFQCHSRLRSP